MVMWYLSNMPKAGSSVSSLSFLQKYHWLMPFWDLVIWHDAVVGLWGLTLWLFLSISVNHGGPKASTACWRVHCWLRLWIRFVAMIGFPSMSNSVTTPSQSSVSLSHSSQMTLTHSTWRMTSALCRPALSTALTAVKAGKERWTQESGLTAEVYLD